MGRATGFEPVISCATDRRLRPLGYARRNDRDPQTGADIEVSTHHQIGQYTARRTIETRTGDWIKSLRSAPAMWPRKELGQTDSGQYLVIPLNLRTDSEDL